MGFADGAFKFIEALHICGAEIDDLGVAVAIDHHVLRLQIAMHDLQPLKGTERFRYFAYQAANVVDGRLGIVEHPLAQAAAFDVLRDEIQEAALRPRQHLHHAGVIDPFADPLFAQETVEVRGILREGFGRCLQCHALSCWAFHQIEMAARSAGEHTEHSVVVDAGADAKHGGNHLRCKTAVYFVDALFGRLIDAHQQAACVVLAALRQGGIHHRSCRAFERSLSSDRLGKRTGHALLELLCRQHVVDAVRGEQQHVASRQVLGQIVHLQIQFHAEGVGEHRPAHVIPRELLQIPAPKPVHAAVAHVEDVRCAAFGDHGAHRRRHAVVVAEPTVERVQHPGCRSLDGPGIRCGQVFVDELRHRRLAGLLGAFAAG